MLLSQFSNYDRIYSSSFSRKRDEEDNPAVEVNIGLGESGIGYRPRRSNTALKTGLGLGALYLLSQGGGGKPPPFAGAGKVPKIVKKTADAVGIPSQVQRNPTKVTQVGVSPPPEEAAATLKATKEIRDATPTQKSPGKIVVTSPSDIVLGGNMLKMNTERPHLTIFTKIPKSKSNPNIPEKPQSTILPRSKYAKRIYTKNFTNPLNLPYGYQ